MEIGQLTSLQTVSGNGLNSQISQSRGSNLGLDDEVQAICVARYFTGDDSPISGCHAGL